MALNEDYEVNDKLAQLLETGGTGGRDVASMIRGAFVDAPDAVLVKLMVDLRALVPLLNERRTDAVQALLDLDWTTKSHEVVCQHSALLVSVAAAHGCHLSGVVRFFVKQFLPSSSVPSTESLDEYDARTSETKKPLLNEAHKCLALILDILPTSERTVMKTLRECYPFIKRHVAYLRDYSRNLFTVISYAPNLRLDILRLIVDEEMKLDTACSHEALEAATGQSTSSSNESEVFFMESDHNEGKKPGVDEILDTREKLDTCMYDFLEYLSSFKGVEEEESMSLYTDLLTIFETSVLPVYSSHHVQFLWFVYCSFDEKLWKHFLSWLWQHVQTPSTSSSIRQNAASYLASYLCRANYLDVNVVIRYVQWWVQWIHSYIDNREGTGGKENAQVHSTFYSLCQAVFYVIVFRIKDILAMRKGHEFLKQLNLDRVVTCRLNPLKYCAEKVVVNFANVSRTYQFAFCYTVIERNRRSAFFDQRRTGLAPHQLMECFFPFDPFLLPKSISFVRPLYREYEEGAMEVEEQATCVKKVQNDGEDDFLDSDMEFSPTGRDDIMETTRQLMFSYSISPGFKHG